MPLGDLGAFAEWAHREDPSYRLAMAIRGWIEGLARSPWQAPSLPIPEMSLAGEYQTRIATVLGIEIIYQEQFADGRVDLLHVGTAPVT